MFVGYSCRFSKEVIDEDDGWATYLSYEHANNFFNKSYNILKLENVGCICSMRLSEDAKELAVGTKYGKIFIYRFYYDNANRCEVRFNLEIFAHGFNMDQMDSFITGHGPVLNRYKPLMVNFVDFMHNEENGQNLVVSGGGDGRISVWNTQEKKPCYERKVPCSITTGKVLKQQNRYYLSYACGQDYSLGKCGDYKFEYKGSKIF